MTRTLLGSHETTTRARRTGRDGEVADFVAAHQAALLRTAYLLTGDKDAARELVSSCLAKLYLSWDTVRAGEGAEAFVRRRMFTAHSSSWRLPLRRRADSSVDGGELWHRIQGLPPRQRAVVVLRHYEGLSEADAADVLGMREHAVRTLLHRARSSLGVSVAA